MSGWPIRFIAQHVPQVSDAPNTLFYKGIYRQKKSAQDVGQSLDERTQNQVYLEKDLAGI